MESQNIEFRAVIKFLTKEGAKTKEIHWRMADVYGDSSPKYSTVAKWSAEFKHGRDSLEDDPRPGRPSGSVQCQSRRLSYSSCNRRWKLASPLGPDTKKESMQWKRPGSPPPKKFRSQPSASKKWPRCFGLQRDYIDRLQACWYFNYRRILCQCH